MTAITKLGAYGASFSKLTTGRYDGKTLSTASQIAILIWQFDLWREGYAGAVVQIFKEGTTSPAAIYSDVNLSAPVANPQVLLTESLNGRTFGKFQTSLYTPDAYYLVVNGIESTGVFYPGIRTLAGEVATEALVVSSQGGVARTAGQRAGDFIHVLDFGNFLQVDGSTTENTTTLTAAIGTAAAANGGNVILPAGTYQISTIALPENVFLVGQGINATILQSREADNVVTVTGDMAGICDLTLDGINLIARGVGIYTVGQDSLTLTNVKVKRFEAGLKARGGSGHRYTNFFIDNCSTCAELRGDLDASSTALGTSFTDLTWQGGGISESTLIGLYLRFVDAVIEQLTIRDVSFTDNVGTCGLQIEGAQEMIFEDLTFTGNIQDHIITLDATANTVENMEFRSCAFTDREIKLGGSCKDTAFDRCTFDGTLVFNLNNPLFAIMSRDGREGSLVTQTGNTEKMSRWKTVDNEIVRGQTTTTVTTATVYKRVLNPGQCIQLEVSAAGVQANKNAFGTIKRSAAAFAPAATLTYVGQTVNFTLGEKVTGAVSGANGILQVTADAGASGTLGLIRLSATTAFVNNELLSAPSGGNGNVQGTIVLNNATILPPVQTDHFANLVGSGATTWDCDVTTSGAEVRVNVIGPTTGTVDWRIQIRQNVVG